LGDASFGEDSLAYQRAQSAARYRPDTVGFNISRAAQVLRLIQTASYMTLMTITIITW
jgi:hypothetical protein